MTIRQLENKVKKGELEILDSKDISFDFFTDKDGIEKVIIETEVKIKDTINGEERLIIVK